MSPLNKQGDNIQPWYTRFPILSQSVVPCPVLTVASWPAYGFLRRQVRWYDIPISSRIFQFVVIPVKSFGVVHKAEVDVFLELSFWLNGRCCCCSVAQSCLTLQLHRLQPTRLIYPAVSPGVCSDSCPLSLWRCLCIVGLPCDGRGRPFQHLVRACRGRTVSHTDYRMLSLKHPHSQKRWCLSWALGKFQLFRQSWVKVFQTEKKLSVSTWR